MLQIPPTQTEWQLEEWHKQYGPIISLKLGGDTLIVIKDREAIRDLWEKKALIYSDRSHGYVAGLLTQQHHAAFQSMGPAWRDRRKLISHYYSPQQCDTVHAEYQNAEALALAKSLLDDPDNFYNLIKRFAAAITGALTYGKRPKKFEDPLCQDVIEAMGYISENMELGAAPPVDEWPFTILRMVPAGFAYWKHRALTQGKRMDAIFGKLWNEFMDRRRSGKDMSCLFQDFLSRAGGTEEESLGSWQWGLHSLQFLGGEILEGGADTTSSTLISFIMAMACYPEAQARCQAQIDAAVGCDRTPQWEDYDKIPYVAQIQKETIRWRCVTVTGTPHVVKEDNFYKGFKSLHMDEEYYPDPDKFFPERADEKSRFEGKTRLADHYQGNSDWKSRDHYGYGGGRRICPGMHLAERNLWRSMSKILWAFEIKPTTDPLTGEPQPPSTVPFSKNGLTSAFTGGAVRVARPFKVNLVPRSPKHAEVLLREFEKATPILSKYD
ncbi:hypothetical protein AK830_g173 [Neonectria ditissima]|uniref:Cytochrome P450 n=1 Tax=Neonectria ditissima TaxID=78410 RepID=A0A0P7BY80_9HYPO|nr:hypothetical protein AK830_g173 [Neonectria ditissima]